MLKTILDEINRLNTKSNEEAILEKLEKIRTELDEIQMETEENAEIDRQIDFFETVLSENLEHMRHVEGERMNFLQINVAIVGGIMAILAEKLSVFNLAVPIVLLVTTIISYSVFRLISRWNFVFKAHRLCAMTAMQKLCSLTECKEYTDFEFKSSLLNNEILNLTKQQKTDKQIRSNRNLYAFSFTDSGKTEKYIGLISKILILFPGLTLIVYMFYHILKLI